MPISAGKRGFLGVVEDNFNRSAGRRHDREIAAQFLKILLEGDGVRAVVRVQSLMDAHDHADAVGRDLQLAGGFGIARRPALQRQKTHDDLKIVQQPVVGFLAQEKLLLDLCVLLAEQQLILRQRLAQPRLRGPAQVELALVTRDAAASFHSELRIGGRIQTGLQRFNGHVACSFGFRISLQSMPQIAARPAAPG
ncbi:MAG: hypothetical protein WDM81_10635 [Rhizomicrobium sp.]